jgi:hypothetical protein
MHHGTEVEKLPVVSPKAFKGPIGVTDDDGKALTPIEVNNSELTENDRKEEKPTQCPDDSDDMGADSSHLKSHKSDIRALISERSGEYPLDSLTQEVYEALCNWMRAIHAEPKVASLCERVFDSAVR